MIYNNEEDFLQLSGIQHFAFCRRQWALVHIEMQWRENVKTTEGEILHQKVHDPFQKEIRGNRIIIRAMPIQSRKLGVSGECDVVEFHRVDKGITLAGYEGRYEVIPIEYKRGSPKSDDVDILQLVAQVLCLEEMLCCSISYGYIYYGETRRRERVLCTQDLRKKVEDMFTEMHQYYKAQYTPKVKPRRNCRSCSLKDICLPILNHNPVVSQYIHNAIKE